jgi:hypothetical protein
MNSTLTPDMMIIHAVQVRQIDCVMVKGSKVPMGLFTYDLDMEAAIASAQANSGMAPPAVPEPFKRMGSSRHFGAGSSRLSAAAAAAAVAAGGGGGGGASSCLDAEACELLLSAQWEDEWLDNPVLASSWALTGAYKQQWDLGFQVRSSAWGLKFSMLGFWGFNARF